MSDSKDKSGFIANTLLLAQWVSNNFWATKWHANEEKHYTCVKTFRMQFFKPISRYKRKRKTTNSLGKVTEYPPVLGKSVVPREIKSLARFVAIMSDKSVFLTVEGMFYRWVHYFNRNLSTNHTIMGERGTNMFLIAICWWNSL